MTGTRFSTGARPRHAWTADLFGLLWVLAAAGAVLAPAFSHGPYLGSFDWVSRFGLSQNPAVVVHDRQTFDQIAEFIPWTKLAWTQVHHGHLPLWNPSSVLGMPLAFTWQAGTFSIPVVLGYLFPVSLSYTVQVVATLVIAGTGVYVLGRVMGLSVLACTMAATVYELSGAFFGWLGWPIASVMSWIGWLCAAAILVVRGGRRARAVAFLALIVACAIYAGQPDTLVLLGTAFLVFMVALLGSRTAPLRGSGPIRRPVLDTVLGVAAGAALGSPLLLPGMQLISGSVRSGKNLSQAVSAQSIMLTLFQGFDGLPVTGSRFFGSGYYTKSVAYVGVIAVVLAVLAVVAAVKLRQRRSEVIGFGAVAVAMAAIVYLPIVESALDGLPLIGSVLWRRATIPLMFGLAVLAGMGTDVLVRSHRGDAVRRWMAVVFGATAVVLLALWAFDRGHLRSMEASIRARSFIWPFALTALGLAVAACFAVGARRHRAGPEHGGGTSTGRWAAALFLVGETVFLVTAGTPLWTSQPAYLTPTRDEATLARAVGSSVVGLGANTCFGSDQLGIVPNYNVALGIKEFAIYEPLIPRTYGESWLAATGEPSAPVQFPGVPFSVFCPAVTSASIARRYGVGFVLEGAGQRGPAGAVFDRAVGHERLYRIPDSGLATLSAAPTGAGLPGPDAAGTVVPVTQPDPSTWTVRTHGTVSQVLRLRLTDVPGWHATIDGRPLALQRFDGVMLQARVPAGRHVVKVWYWPRAFTEGLVLAVVAVAALGGAMLTGWVQRRRRVAVTTSPASANPADAAP
ncbi:MAG: YfhO family protein [Acidimicrobiales bacterium]